ncbi:CBS domain-containing protein [Streptomyces sp. 5.8]|uniref:restriction system modified-DNA reader domain-containing protein n=1 Tax=Streptomyces sp. 5.8 TaxID=3406571 RepID=UPI003BB755EB
MSDAGQQRASYLLDGRRVTLSHLIEAGLLKEGETLTFDRPRVGETHTARIASDHRIELLDGRRFKSPSAAASAAVGTGSFDGWEAWTVTGGSLLSTLRQQLLDDAAEAAEVTEETALSVERHERLKQARHAAQLGKPTTLSVRQLIDWWGAKGRGGLIIRQIHADLANHGLSTSPDFDAVSLDDEVQVVSTTPVLDEVPPAEDAFVTIAPLPDEEEDEPVVGLTVGNLPSALAGVESISPSATFEEAITKMAINGYSQLPVLAGTRNLQGAITWESITRARHADPSAPFSKAFVLPREVRYDRHLVDIIPMLAESDFVLVRDEKNNVAGIVTATDVAATYGEMATPFFLIGEFDQLLRRILVANFDITYAASLCDPEGKRKIEAFDDLSIGDYQQVLGNKDAWEALGWPLDRKVFLSRVNDLREIRNDLMHFNPDPLPQDAVRKIRNMITLLREYGS